MRELHPQVRDEWTLIYQPNMGFIGSQQAVPSQRSRGAATAKYVMSTDLVGRQSVGLYQETSSYTFSGVYACTKVLHSKVPVGRMHYNEGLQAL